MEAEKGADGERGRDGGGQPGLLLHGHRQLRPGDGAAEPGGKGTTLFPLYQRVPLPSLLLRNTFHTSNPRGDQEKSSAASDPIKIITADIGHNNI